MALDGFDDDNSVINHKTNCEHKAKERECVDREAESRKYHECADERNRYSRKWDQRCAPALQEDIHDENHRASAYRSVRRIS